MLALGLSSKREITRTRIRVRTATAAQTREQGRYLGGRPPYGYRLGDAGPHPNQAHAAWGRRAHRLEPDPVTAPVVQWMFRQRLAGHSAARITRALNDAGCRARRRRTRDEIRTGRGWGGRCAPWRRSWPTSGTRVGRCGTGSGPTSTWPIPPTPGSATSRSSDGTCLKDGSSPGIQRMRPWSARPSSSPRRSRPRRAARPAVRRYLLAGLLACGLCGRRLESAWSNGRPAYRCRHGHATPAAQTLAGPGTPTSVRTRSCRTWPLSASCSPALPGNRAAGSRCSAGNRPG